MARAATTSDAFNAVAEPRRREILSYLAHHERPVGDIVAGLNLDQPSVSKHLSVLRRVGLVHMRCDGRHKYYRTNAEAIRPLHEWASTFERLWQHQLLSVKKLAERKMGQLRDGGEGFPKAPGELEKAPKAPIENSIPNEIPANTKIQSTEEKL